MGKKIEALRVVVMEGQEVLYVASLETKVKGTQPELKTLINPAVNALAIADALRQLAEVATEEYYTSKVKFLSEEARETIKKTLDAEGIDKPAPF